MGPLVTQAPRITKGTLRGATELSLILRR